MIEAALVSLEAYFATHSDSDDRASALDKFILIGRTGCTTATQNQRLLKLTEVARVQSHAEEKSFALLGGIFDKVGPYLKIGAGVIGFAVIGVTLVWIAGRRSPVGSAATAVATGPAGAIARRATRQASAPKRTPKPSVPKARGVERMSAEQFRKEVAAGTINTRDIRSRK